MKQEVFDNAQKTRRAVAEGRRVVFYVRKQREGYNALRKVFHESYRTKVDAVKAAECWAAGGGVLLPGKA